MKLIITLTIVFCSGLLLAYYYKRQGLMQVQAALFEQNGLSRFRFRFILGVFLFGILPAVLLWDYPLFHFLQLPKDPLTLLVSVILLIAVVFVSWSASKSLEVDANTLSAFNPSGFDSYLVVRTLYLFSYEFFFRGLLFFALLEYMAWSYAIVICTLLYVIIHGFDTRKEMLGAIPFGIVLCLLTYWSSSIWPAVVLHLALCMAYEVRVFTIIKSKLEVS